MIEIGLMSMESIFKDKYVINCAQVVGSGYHVYSEETSESSDDTDTETNCTTRQEQLEFEHATEKGIDWVVIWWSGNKQQWYITLQSYDDNLRKTRPFFTTQLLKCPYVDSGQTVHLCFEHKHHLHYCRMIDSTPDQIIYNTLLMYLSKANAPWSEETDPQDEEDRWTWS